MELSFFSYKNYNFLFFFNVCSDFMVSSEEIRKKYLDFFKQKNHEVIASASLIPDNDPTVLFTTAGMHPLVPFLMGEKHPKGNRLVNFQKCLRTQDIDEVGNQWHFTFFEMLGNWSLGDYFKKESLTWSFEFLTDKKWLGLDKDRISVTVFAGDDTAPRDDEAAEIWKSVGIPEDKIYYFSREENWWGPAGNTGPCGPDSEIFYDTGKPKCSDSCDPSCSCGKYVEIWNNVFMQYNKTKAGDFVALTQKNVDTGMGLERIVAVLNNYNSNYDSDLMKPIVDAVLSVANKDYDDLIPEQVKSLRIVAEHLRASVFILGEDEHIVPSNVDQGYILRRLIRRAIKHSKFLGINHNFCADVAEVVVDRFEKIYPELYRNKDRIFVELNKEETKFSNTLHKGLKLLHSELKNLKDNNEKILSGKIAFDLFQSFGFPIEITKEVAIENGFDVDVQNFDNLFRHHQELSRKGAEKRFKGGLADSKEETKRLHTATHLMNAALRRILGNHVFQKGSNITAERLRFDFSHPEKISSEKLKEIEDLVNSWVKRALDIKMEIMPVADAKKSGAIGVFDDRYDENVKVYSVFDSNTNEVISKEICRGPHVNNTSELGIFKILKEESVSAGVRRIKAVLK